SVAFIVFGSSRTPPPVTAALQYASSRGEVRNIALPDGSAVTLDAQSTVVARFGANARNIDLERGRAFFAVAPDPAKPFAVTAGDRRVIAVGTRFDVNVTPLGMMVTLVQGHVRIESADGAASPVMLEPGQQYIERSGAAEVRTIGAAS